MTRTGYSLTTVRKERKFRSGPYLDQLFVAAGGRVDAYLEQQICARIKKARHEAGFTQEEMANLLNVTVRAYQNYEHNRVPFRRLGEIARLANVTQEWLLRGDSLPSTEAGLVQDVADAVAELERSQVAAHSKLDEILARLARLEGDGSRPATARPRKR